MKGLFFPALHIVFFGMVGCEKPTPARAKVPLNLLPNAQSCALWPEPPKYKTIPAGERFFIRSRDYGKDYMCLDVRTEAGEAGFVVWSSSLGIVEEK